MGKGNELAPRPTQEAVRASTLSGVPRTPVGPPPGLPLSEDDEESSQNSEAEEAEDEDEAYTCVSRIPVPTAYVKFITIHMLSSVQHGGRPEHNVSNVCKITKEHEYDGNVYRYVLSNDGGWVYWRLEE